MYKKLFLFFILLSVTACAPNANTYYSQTFTASGANTSNLISSNKINVSTYLRMDIDHDAFIANVESQGYVFLGYSTFNSYEYRDIEYILDHAKSIKAVLAFVGEQYIGSETRTGSSTTYDTQTSYSTSNTNATIYTDGYGYVRGSATTNTTTTTYIPRTVYYQYDVGKYHYLALFFGKVKN